MQKEIRIVKALVVDVHNNYMHGKVPRVHDDFMMTLATYVRTSGYGERSYVSCVYKVYVAWST